MKVMILSLVLASALDIAAGSAVVAPRTAASYKPQATSYGTEAATIPQMLSYQGRLTDTLGQPVPDGNYQLTFRLYTQPTGGSAIWTEGQTIQVVDGLFSALLGAVTPISTVPDAGILYLGLQVAVTPELTPRLRLASAAYAYVAARAADADLLQGKDSSAFVRSDQANSIKSAMVVDGTISAADLGQMGASSGQVMKWNGSNWAPRNDSIGSSGGDSTWVRGSPDSVLFTVRQLGIARGAANNMLHGSNRFTHVNLGVACTTGASGRNVAYATVGGGYDNSASEQYSTIAGGDSNWTDGTGTTVGGGHRNVALTSYATVAGGYRNQATGLYTGALSGRGHFVGGSYSDSASCVAGGWTNDLEGSFGFIGAGQNNVILNGHYGVIGGGLYNRIDGVNYSVVVGGDSNRASGARSFIGGGHRDSAGASYCGVMAGYRNIAGKHAADSFATICGGLTNTADSTGCFIGGGARNTAKQRYATIAGGDSNVAEGEWSVVAGGLKCRSSGNSSFVGGGQFNHAGGSVAVIPGGSRDTVLGDRGFATNWLSMVPASYSNSAAFNGQTVTASDQTRVGILSKASGTFTIDHPLDPYGKILNHYFVESPEMSNIYSGSVTLGADGRGEVRLPDYFDALNRNPRVQLTGVATYEVFVAEDISNNRFTVGGKPGTKVYWQVTGERKDVSAEVTRRMMPVEQPKSGELAGRMLDDDFLVGCMEQLVREGKVQGIDFRTAGGRQRYEQIKQHLRELPQR